MKIKPITLAFKSLLTLLLVIPSILRAQEQDSYWEDGNKYEVYNNGPIEISGFVIPAKTPVGKKNIFFLNLYNHSEQRVLLDLERVQVLGYKRLPIENNTPHLLETLTADQYEQKVKSRAFGSAFLGVIATTALVATAAATDDEVVSDIAAEGAVLTSYGTAIGVTDKLLSRHRIYYDYLKKTTLEKTRSAHGILLTDYSKRYKALILRISLSGDKTHEIRFYPDKNRRIVRYENNQ
ncbi:hypothetical protein K4L44_07725 [Halosquirtibacter laminarini]|uniref:Uncharacterized protein n=1 Tax=Halosquirtibacter laminarini TaxID=3374600 RepID=A0AC61NIZ4_9BACT|nr:hypothetical protein K4L44_07725 [Prolixibacteraceae bacterium]